MRKLAVTVLGSITVLVGVVLLVLPGPGVLLILLGIAILSLEFAWAQRSLEWMRRKVRRTSHSGSDEHDGTTPP